MGLRRRSKSSFELQRLLAAIEENYASVVRDHQAAVARLDARIDVLWAIAVPAWIREAIPHAEANGWRVETTPNAIIFRHFDREDELTIPLPLSAEEATLVAYQRDLHLRLGFLGPSARAISGLSAAPIPRPEATRF